MSLLQEAEDALNARLEEMGDLDITLDLLNVPKEEMEDFGFQCSLRALQRIIVGQSAPMDEIGGAIMHGICVGALLRDLQCDTSAQD